MSQPSPAHRGQITNTLSPNKIHTMSTHRQDSGLSKVMRGYQQKSKTRSLSLTLMVLCYQNKTDDEGYSMYHRSPKMVTLCTTDHQRWLLNVPQITKDGYSMYHRSPKHDNTCRHSHLYQQKSKTRSISLKLTVLCYEDKNR